MPSSFVESIKDFAPQTALRSTIRKIFFPRSHIELQFAVDSATAERTGLNYEDQFNKSDWFEAVSLTAIFINAIVLANADPLNPDSAINQLIDYVDAIMTFFFLAELVLRVICFGMTIFEAEAWFVVDLVVVIAGLLSWILSFISTGSSLSLSALRAIRLLRPLRSVRVITSVRLFLAALIEAVTELADVMFLLVIFILILSVAGVSQYNSRLRYHCIGMDFQHSLPLERTGITNINEFMPFGKYEVTRQETFVPVYNIILRDRVPYRDLRYLIDNGTFAGTSLMLEMLSTPGCFPYYPFVPCSRLVRWPPEGDPYGISWNYTESMFTNYTAMLENNNTAPVFLNLTAINESEPGINERLPFLAMMRTCYADRPSTSESMSVTFSHDISETYSRTISIFNGTTTTTTTTYTSLTTIYNFSSTSSTTQPPTTTTGTTTTPAPTRRPGGPPVIFPEFDEEPYDIFKRFLRCWGTYQDPYEYEAIFIYKDRNIIQDWWYGIWEVQTCNNVSSIVFQGYSCPHGYDCRLSGNPFFGLVGFDNLPQAAMTVFICITLELYGDLASQMADAVDATAIFYFLIIVLFGSFFILNLAIAQMTVAFAEAAEAEQVRLNTEDKTIDKREVSKVEELLQKFNAWMEEQKKAEYVPIRENDNLAEGDAQAMKELTALIAQRKRHEREREKLKSRIAAEIAAGGTRARELFSSENLEEIGPAKVFLTRWQKRRRNTRNFLYNKWMQLLVIIMIVLNLAQLASEFYGMPQIMVDIYYWVGFGFTCFFTLEFGLRMFAIGPITVMTRSFADWIDFIVIFMSWLSFGVEALNFPVVRTFRVLRIFVLMQNSPALQKWVMVIASSARQMTVLFFVTFASIFILSCIAVQIFGAQFCGLGEASEDERPDDTFAGCPNRPRANFDALSTAMLTNFQIMTADNWNTVMFIGMRAFGNGAALYFIGWYGIGNLVLANVVIAILVVAMSEAVDQSRKEAEELALIRQEYEDPEAAASFTEADKLKKIKEEKIKEQREQLQERRSRSDFQQQMVELTQTQAYERGYIGLLVVSCVCTAMERPRDAPDMTSATLFSNVEFVSQIFFFFDVVVKIFAYGFIKNKYSYMRRSAWFVFDFVVMTCTGLGAFVSYLSIRSSVLQVFRVGRALRPLRLVAFSEGMLGVAKTLRDALVPMRSLLIIVLSGFVIWGVMGVQLFSGSFYSCSIPDYANRTSCEENDGSWVNAERHFDHLGAAMKTLFTVVSLDNWVDVQWNCVDAVAPEESFRVNYNIWGAFFPVSFVVVGSFFLLNLFVSVLIDAYQAQKSLEGRTPFVTEAQAGWIKTQQTVVGLVPLVDYDDDAEQVDGNPAYIYFRKQVRALVRHPLADVLVYCFIAVNFIVMAADRFPKSDTSADVIALTNALFTFIFTIECVLKLIAEGWTRYFKSKWNSFDFFVVLFSLLGIIVENAMSSTTIASAFRTLRVLRLFRLLRKSRRLQVVIKKFAFALLSLKNISALIGLFFTVFAIIGVKIFGRLAEGPEYRRRSTFSNLQNAMTMLLRAVTAENWTLHMIHASISEKTSSFCEDHLGNCGVFGFSETYYIIFVTIGAFIFLNLFIAVVLDAYSNARHVDSDAFTEWEGGQLLLLWLRFDPEMKFRMHSRFLVTFLRSIPPTCVLGWGNMPSRRRLQHEVIAVDALGVKELVGLVELQDIITALCRVSFHSELPEDRRRGLQKKANTRFRTDDRNRDKPDEKTLIPAVQRFAVMIIEAYFLRRYEVLERRRHYADKRKRRLRQNRVLANTFGVAEEDDEEENNKKEETSVEKDKNKKKDKKNNNNTNENDDDSSGSGDSEEFSLSSSDDDEDGERNKSRSQSKDQKEKDPSSIIDADGNLDLPPEAKAAHMKLQAAVKKAKEAEAEAAKLRRFNPDGWQKTHDSNNNGGKGNFASNQFRSSGTPISSQQSKLNQIESSIGARSVGKKDLWADVTDMIEVGGSDNLVHLGNAILKKQQAARDAEERAKAKKLEEERAKLATKQSDMSFDDIAKLLMPDYNKQSTWNSGSTINNSNGAPAAESGNNNNNNRSGSDGKTSSSNDSSNHNNNHTTNSNFLNVPPPQPKKVSKYQGNADFDLL